MGHQSQAIRELEGAKEELEGAHRVLAAQLSATEVMGGGSVEEWKPLLLPALSLLLGPLGVRQALLT